MQRSHVLATAVVGGLLCAGHGRGAECRYEIAAIMDVIPCPSPPLPSGSPPLRAINDRGEAVGSFGVCGVVYEDAFYWSEETGIQFLPLPVPNVWSRAAAINNDGLIMGNMLLQTPHLQCGFVMKKDGSDFSLILPSGGANYLDAHAMNNRGEVTGYMVDILGSEGARPFIWTGGLPLDFGPDLGRGSGVGRGINDAGVITGEYFPSGPNQTAFVWDGARFTDLGLAPNGIWSRGVSINSRGDVAGIDLIDLVPGGTQRQAFSWIGGVRRSLGVLEGADESFASFITDSGIVGGVCTGFGVQVAYLFVDGTMFRAEDLVCDAPPGLRIYDVNGASRRGDIVGYANIPSTGTRGIVLRALPLPADLDGNGTVDGFDLAMMLAHWGPCRCAADLNHDGMVDGLDLAALLGAWSG